MTGTDARLVTPRPGTVNCMTDEPKWNVSHLIVSNLSPQLGLAICGVTLDAGDQPKFHADRGGPGGDGVCLCAPADQWARCQGCVDAKVASDARRAERGAP